MSVEVEKSKYSLFIVSEFDVSGIIAGGISYEIVLINVGHKLSTLNVE
jgi:hypothetical protein